MKLYMDLQRKVRSYPPPPCEIQRVVEVTPSQFCDFLDRPQYAYPFISENKTVIMREAHVTPCLLLLARNREDGVLVAMDDGYGWARDSAYLPGASLLLNSRLEQAADWIILFATSHDGIAMISYDDLYDETGLVVQEDNGLGVMLAGVLCGRKEVYDVTVSASGVKILTMDYAGNLVSSYAPAQTERPPLKPRIKPGGPLDSDMAM